jgi:hypothetical protein
LSKFVHFSALRFDLTDNKEFIESVYNKVLNQSITFSAYLIYLYMHLFKIDKNAAFCEAECILVWQ